MKNQLYAMTIILAALLAAATSFAEKMSVETHTALIQKLESVYSFSEESVSKQNMTIRLADLYSERARMYAMLEEGRGDVKYKKEIKSDRSRALGLYEKAFKNEKNTEKKGLILFQRAHLQHLQGQSIQAKKLYDDIIKDKQSYDAQIVAQAHIEAGDYEFNKGNFKKSKEHFDTALKTPNIVRASYAKYRIAWCEFHIGRTEVAIKNLRTLLSDVQSFKKSNGEHDQSFQEEASRDYATFIARRDLKDGDIESVLNLSPENVRQANLTYLATELDRTGKKKSALRVWAIIGLQNPNSESKLEGQIKIARIQYDLGKKAQTVVEIQKAVELLKDDDCDDISLCNTQQQQIRKIITDWGMAEEKTPSVELVEAYKVYTFDDAEMAFWGAQAAQKRKQWKDAFALFNRSANLSHQKIKSIKSDNKKSFDKSIYNIFEGSLLGSIDSAEQSQDLTMRSQAYDQYLKLNANGSKALEVEYQIAQVALEEKKYEEAAQKFKSVAYSERKDTGVKDKAADLSLDTLVILKDDKKIEQWANEYAHKFPKRKKEFQTIARKAVLNQAAQVINTSNSKSDLDGQYEKLAKTDMSTATEEEKKSFNKHRILIAGKTKNLDALISSTNSMLKSKNISQKERNELLSQQAWAYEMKLDFKSAYKTLKKINPEKSEVSEHTLKLGITSELAGQNPTNHYEDYISISNNKFKKQNVALSLVRISKNKNKTFQKYKSLLRDNSTLYMAAGMYAYDEKPTDTLRGQLLAQRGSGNTFEGQLLIREIGIERIEKDQKELTKHKLEPRNQNTLGRSIQKRISLLNSFERKTQKIVESKDFTLQFVALQIVAKENRRLANDILKLPAPKGLKKQQREEYRKLVAEQVKPYQEKAAEVTSTLSKLWSEKESSAFEEVLTLSYQTQAPGNKTAKGEVKIVKRVAGILGYDTSDMAKKWQQRQKMSQKLGQLKTKIRQNPFDSSYLKEMKEIEEQLNPGPMVAYLNSRIDMTDGGGRN